MRSIREIAAVLVGVALLTGGCIEDAPPAQDFAAAVQEGEPCYVLFAIRNELPPRSPAADHANDTLRKIGCDSTESSRIDAPTGEPSPPVTTTTSGSVPKPIRRYAVLDVVDGDTVTVGYRGGTSVRVIGIDTPETVHPSVPDECWGARASAAAHRLLAGKRIALVFDATQGRTDTYGRTLAYLRVPGLGDYGLAMIRRGHAAEYTYDVAYQRQTRYRHAESRARSAGTGLWRACGGPDAPVQTPEPQQLAGHCESGYTPCVPPYPPDVDCADVAGPVRVTGADPHGLDADGDGSGCES